LEEQNGKQGKKDTQRQSSMFGSEQKNLVRP